MELNLIENPLKFSSSASFFKYTYVTFNSTMAKIIFLDSHLNFPNFKITSNSNFFFRNLSSSEQDLIRQIIAEHQSDNLKTTSKII